MSVWNLGSINADLFYSVPHLPGPGETLASTAHRRGLGGKGANVSVAAARAAARVYHIGSVGHDGGWAVSLLLEYGVDPLHIDVQSDVATGHAIIATDEHGENNIILFPGANHEISTAQLEQALSSAEVGDWFVCQNESNAQPEACALAKKLGLNIAYIAAPFDVDAVSAVLSDLDLLVLNEVEAQQLSDALGKQAQDLGVSDVVITLGDKGAVWYREDADPYKVAPIAVQPVDTTGAGDTFAGYLIACLDRGLRMEQALTTANTAAAIMVTRLGTADVIPDLKDLEEFRGV